MPLRAAQPRRNGCKKGTEPMTLAWGPAEEYSAGPVDDRERLCFVMGYEHAPRFCRDDMEAAASRQIVTEVPQNTFTVFREPP